MHVSLRSPFGFRDKEIRAGRSRLSIGHLLSYPYDSTSHENHYLGLPSHLVGLFTFSHMAFIGSCGFGGNVIHVGTDETALFSHPYASTSRENRYPRLHSHLFGLFTFSHMVLIGSCGFGGNVVPIGTDETALFSYPYASTSRENRYPRLPSHLFGLFTFSHMVFIG